MILAHVHRPACEPHQFPAFKLSVLSSTKPKPTWLIMMFRIKQGNSGKDPIFGPTDANFEFESNKCQVSILQFVGCTVCFLIFAGIAGGS